jgi:hypothetical protein
VLFKYKYVKGGQCAPIEVSKYFANPAAISADSAPFQFDSKRINFIRQNTLLTIFWQCETFEFGELPSDLLKG